MFDLLSLCSLRKAVPMLAVIGAVSALFMASAPATAFFEDPIIDEPGEGEPGDGTDGQHVPNPSQGTPGWNFGGAACGCLVNGNGWTQNNCKNCCRAAVIPAGPLTPGQRTNCIAFCNQMGGSICKQCGCP